MGASLAVVFAVVPDDRRARHGVDLQYRGLWLHMHGVCHISNLVCNRLTVSKYRLLEDAISIAIETFRT